MLVVRKNTYLKILLHFDTIHLFILCFSFRRQYLKFLFTNWPVLNGGFGELRNHPPRYDTPELVYCWIVEWTLNIRVVPSSLKYWVSRILKNLILENCNTGILVYSNTFFLQYWDTANWDLLNSIHITTIYTIYLSYILCMF